LVWGCSEQHLLVLWEPKTAASSVPSTLPPAQHFSAFYRIRITVIEITAQDVGGFFKFSETHLIFINQTEMSFFKLKVFRINY
jgi:hypothetical protein